MYGRLSALPDRAEPLQRAQLLAALSVGTKIIQLRRITQRLNLQSELDAALESIVWGDSAAAVSRLAALDKTLATRPGSAAVRARGRILAMSETLSEHAVYFDAGVAGEAHRNQPVRLLCRADVVDDGCRLGGDDRTALVRRPFRPDAIRSPRATPSAPRCGSEGVHAA